MNQAGDMVVIGSDMKQAQVFDKKPYQQQSRVVRGWRIVAGRSVMTRRGLMARSAVHGRALIRFSARQLSLFIC